MQLGQLIMAAVQAKDPEADMFHLEDDRLIKDKPIMDDTILKKILNNLYNQVTR
jgi:hypothetical protein